MERREERKETAFEDTFVSISIDRGSRPFLRDLRRYPHGTMTAESRKRLCEYDKFAKDILQIERIGDGSLEAPLSIVKRWYDEHFPDLDSFIRCSHSSMALRDLNRRLFSSSPFYCITITASVPSVDLLDRQPLLDLIQGVTVPTDTTRVESATGTPSNPDGAPAPQRPIFDRRQSIVNVCANPSAYVTFKNRHAIRCYTNKTNVLAAGSSSSSSSSGSKLTVKNKDRSRVPRKKKSIWTLIAYAVMNDRNHEPSLISKLMKETNASKGTSGRIRTLFRVARKHDLPIWLSDVAVKILGCRGMHDVIRQYSVSSDSDVSTASNPRIKKKSG
jgi:hypothetical protein